MLILRLVLTEVQATFSSIHTWFGVFSSSASSKPQNRQIFP